MKKLLIVLLALTVLGVFAFAQDAEKATVTLTGKVETGMQFLLKDKTVAMHDDDSGTPGRVDLDVKATLGDFELGYYLRDDDISGASGTHGITVPNYWVGYSFLDKMVTLRAGNTDASTTKTVNKGWGNGIDSKNGVQLIAAPVAGLQIGGAWGYLSDTQIDYANKSNAAVGFTYAITDIGALCANYESVDKLFTAGFNYTGMPNLTAQLEMYYIANSDIQEMEFFQNVAYAMGALKPMLAVYEGKTKDAAFSFKINPEVDYTVSPVILIGVSGNYTSDKDAYAFKDITTDKAYNFSPFVQFNFNALASCLKIWYDSGDLNNSGAGQKLEINFRSFF